MKQILTTALLIVVTTAQSYGQLSTSEKKPVHASHVHDGKNELGLALSPAYFLYEKTLTFAMHIHYTRMIPKSKLGFGVGYEKIVLDPKHSTFGLILAYYPVKNLNFTLSPGMTFENGDPDPFFALHLETAYEFEVGPIHIGPAFEYAYDPNDHHLSLGIHIGYPF